MGVRSWNATVVEPACCRAVETNEVVPVYSKVKRTEKRAIERLLERARGREKASDLAWGVVGHSVKVRRAHRDDNAAINLALKSLCGEGLDEERT